MGSPCSPPFQLVQVCERQDSCAAGQTRRLALEERAIGDEEQSAVFESFKQLPIKTVRTITPDNSNATAATGQQRPIASSDRPQQHLFLATDDVEKLFPHAVKTMSRPANNKAQDKKSNKGQDEKGQQGDDQKAQASKSSVSKDEQEGSQQTVEDVKGMDVTQLMYAHMAVTQQLIKANGN